MAKPEVDAFIEAFPEHTREMLQNVRKAIHNAAPDAEEYIGYMMPAYKFHGALVYFSGYKNHIGFYPGAAGVAYFKDEIAKYKTAKGSIQFPLDEPVPVDLIGRIVAFRVRENLEKAAAKSKKTK
ncbi:hypothetical protein HYN49_09005 [Flavobacterium pallidum]|uniref:YdhG-like domain-containing protein n=2 Tax=Flavobacterium pallidum TaxID=2172098 RepID=A0A2S1SLG0_9FLAO|nr:hypothetical protein HYN49_09005 [Flavobacterium pallidum]